MDWFVAHEQRYQSWRSTAMRALRPLLAVCLAVLLAVTPSFGGVMEHDLCEVCGRSWPKSPSRIRFSVVLNRHSTQIHVCSPFCFCERIERYAGREYELQGAQVIDYSSLQDETPRWAGLENATYLVGIDGDIKQANAPLVAAFARAKTATAAQEQLGGEITAWDELYQQCVKLAAEHQPEMPPGQRNPNRRPDRR